MKTQAATNDPEARSERPRGPFVLRKRAIRGGQRTLFRIVVTAILGAWLSGCPAPQVTQLRVLTDPRGDDHGPGTYVYPHGKLYRPGNFDLAELRLAVRGAELEIEVRFARPVPVARGVRLSTDTLADLFLPTVDIYLDLDREPGSGMTQGLPGRRLGFASEHAWDAVVLLSPVPSRVAPLVEDVGGGTAVEIAWDVKVRGRSLLVRVPVGVLRGRRLQDIGVGAAVTATVFDTTFRSHVEGQLPTAFVREITPKPGECGRWEEAPDGAPCTFGGCKDGCEAHPRVIDALHPDPGVQERELSRYETAGDAMALLPLVYAAGSAAPKGPDPAKVGFAVLDRRGPMVTVRAPRAAKQLSAGQLADGLNAAGEPVATLAITNLLDGGVVVLKVVDGDAEAMKRVRFAR